MASENTHTAFHSVKALVLSLWKNGFLKFACCSLFCWSLDQLLAAALADYLLPLLGVTEIAARAWVSGFVARVISAGTNFLINRKATFHASDQSFIGTAVRYIVLATAIICCSNAGVTLLIGVGLPRWIAKICCDFVLYFANFTGQRFWVFRRKEA